MEEGKLEMLTKPQNPSHIHEDSESPIVWMHTGTFTFQFAIE